jgi:hypothetical protein
LLSIWLLLAVAELMVKSIVVVEELAVCLQDMQV